MVDAPGRAFSATLFSCALAGSLLASSQLMAAQVPGAIDPSRVERDLRPLPEPSSKPQPPRREPAVVQPSAEDEQVRFLLRGIELEGNNTLPASQFEDLWRAQVDQETSLGEIKEIARQITTRYRNAGYILTQALVPAQTVGKGVVTIKVVEGFVAKVQPEEGQTLEGTANGYAGHIAESKPLHIADLERWLLLMNDLPGLSAQSVFRPSPKVPGGADLTLKTERTSYAALFSVNNRAGEHYQDWAEDLAVSANNLLGFDEGLFLRAAIAGDGAAGESGGYRNFSLGLGLPLGDRGLKYDLTLDHTTSVPGGDIEGLGYEGYSESARMRVEYPFERSRSRSLYGHVGFDLAHSGLDLHHTVISEDRLSILRAGFSMDWAGWGGLTLVSLEGSAGLDLLDASQAGDENLSRAEGDGEFFKAYLDMVHIRPLWEGGQLRADLLAQTADRKLLSGEEFSVGGARIGRGYDSSEILGDNGAGLGLEIAHSFSPELQGYGFWDIGMTTNKTGGREDLASAGAGVRYRYGTRLNTQLELGVPLTRPVGSADEGEGNDWRIFFNASLSY